MVNTTVLVKGLVERLVARPSAVPPLRHQSSTFYPFCNAFDIDEDILRLINRLSRIVELRLLLFATVYSFQKHFGKCIRMSVGVNFAENRSMILYGNFPFLQEQIQIHLSRQFSSPYYLAQYKDWKAP